MKRWVTIVIPVLLLAVVAAAYLLRDTSQPLQPAIASFKDCAAAGYPIMESYPRRCAVPGGDSFTEEIGNELEKADLIRIDSPRPMQPIFSPLTITGQARGTWFFEASFPVKLVDQSGVVLASGIAQAQGEWMTAEFVPFIATLTFSSPGSGNANLVLQKDNPSGLPENDDQLMVPVVLSPAPSPARADSDCPDQKIVNRMPPGPETSYYIEAGQRREIGDYDEQWVAANCKVPVETAY